MNPAWIIRSDGGTIRTMGGVEKIASGHLMRMLNIARKWRTLERVVHLVINHGCEGVNSFLDRYQMIGCEIVKTSAGISNSTDDALELARIASQAGAAVIYLDGYHFGSSYQRQVYESGSPLIPLVVQDDTGSEAPYFANLIVGGHVHAPGLNYNAPETTRLLLGATYALIADEVKRLNVPRQVPQLATHLLVSLGSCDYLADTEKCLNGLRRLDLSTEINRWLGSLEIAVVIGANNPRVSEIDLCAKSLSAERACRITVYRDLPSLSNLMEWADIAFSATGGTVLELLCAGVPVALQIVHPVQVEIAKKMVDLELCELVGDSQNLSREQCEVMENRIGQSLFDLARSPDRRGKYIRLGQKEIDGRGVDRVCEAIDRMVEMRGIHERAFAFPVSR